MIMWRHVGLKVHIKRATHPEKGTNFLKNKRSSELV